MNMIGKLSWKKKVLGAIFILVVILVGIRIITNKPTYTFDTVKRSTVSELVTETGNVTVAGEYDIPSPTTGILSEIFVKNGTKVAKGDKLFMVKSTSTPTQKATALAAYLSAKSTLDTANADLYSLQSAMYTKWKTYTDLAENSTYQNSDGSPNTTNRVLTDFTTAQDDWLAAEADYKKQQGVISHAQAALTSASLSYQATQDTLVIAPVSGTVHNLGGVVGSVASAVPSATGVVPPVVILSTGTTDTIVTPVNEVDINKIDIGEPVTITFDAVPGTTYHGKIVQVDSYGTNNQGVINYNVYTLMTDTDKNVKSGMTANISIETKTRKNVLSVVNAAVRPYKGARAVEILGKNGKPEYVPVVTGIKGADRTEIIKGVQEGTKVIVATTKKTSPILGGP